MRRGEFRIRHHRPRQNGEPGFAEAAYRAWHMRGRGDQHPALVCAWRQQALRKDGILVGRARGRLEHEAVRRNAVGARIGVRPVLAGAGNDQLGVRELLRQGNGLDHARVAATQGDDAIDRAVVGRHDRAKARLERRDQQRPDGVVPRHGRSQGRKTYDGSGPQGEPSP